MQAQEFWAWTFALGKLYKQAQTALQQAAPQLALMLATKYIIHTCQAPCEAVKVLQAL